MGFASGDFCLVGRGGNFLWAAMTSRGFTCDDFGLNGGRPGGGSGTTTAPGAALVGPVLLGADGEVEGPAHLHDQRAPLFVQLRICVHSKEARVARAARAGGAQHLVDLVQGYFVFFQRAPHRGQVDRGDVEHAVLVRRELHQNARRAG